MHIIFDHDLFPDGSVSATHSIDTSDPAVQAMLTSLKGNVANQTTSGYNVPSKLSAYNGQTRWQAVLGEVVRLNDATARGILGV